MGARKPKPRRWDATYQVPAPLRYLAATYPGFDASRMQNPASDAPATYEVSDPACLPTAPVVSVVMLAYGHETTLADAIEGVLAQRFGAFELLIGEDCSPDRTREIALEYQRQHPDRIRVLYGDRNVGGLENSRRLVHAARGRLIAFCEGDDYWTDPRKLQMQVEIFEADDSVTLVHTDFDRLMRGRLMRHYQKAMNWPTASGPEAFSVLLRANKVVTATSMYRTSILRELSASGISRPDWPFGDYPKSLYAALRGKVVRLPMSTAVYRHLPGSATARGRIARLNMYQAAHECREVFLAMSAMTEAEKLAVLVDSRKSLLSMAVMAGSLAVYDANREWLASHGHPPGRARHMLSLLTMRFGPVLRAFRLASRLRKEIRQRMRFGWFQHGQLPIQRSSPTPRRPW